MLLKINKIIFRNINTSQPQDVALSNNMFRAFVATEKGLWRSRLRVTREGKQHAKKVTNFPADNHKDVF